MEFEDEKVKQLMQHSKLEMPFSDFDDAMLAKIEVYESKKRVSSQSRFYATLFFLIGTVFGSILNFLLSQNLSRVSVSIDIQEKVYWFSQLVYVVFILLFSDRLWKAISLYKKNKKALIR